MREIRTVFPIIVMLGAILLGPVAVVSIAGKTPKVFWVDIVLIIILGIWLLKGQLFTLRLAGVEKWFALYVLIATLSLVSSKDILLSISLIQRLAFTLLIFIVAYNCLKTRHNVRIVIGALYLFVVVLSILLLYNGWQFTAGMKTLETEAVTKSMAQIKWGRSNYLASFFIIFILPLFSLIITKPHRRLILKLGAAGVIILALLFAQSRGAILSILLGIFLGIGLGIVSGQFVKTRFFIVILLCFVIVFATAWLLLPRQITNNFTAYTKILIEQMTWDRISIYRIQLINEAWAVAKNHLITGIGIGNQGFVLSDVASVHNLYLETLLETGLIGLFALSAYLLSVGRRFYLLWKRSNDKRAHMFTGSLLISYFISMINAAQEPSFWGPEYAGVLAIYIATVCAMMKTGVPELWGRKKTVIFEIVSDKNHEAISR